MRRYKIILYFLVFNFLCATAAFGLIDNWYHYEQGMRMISAKNYNQALREFTYYLDHPDIHRHMFGVAYFGRALMFQDKKNYQQAIDEFKLAIQNDLHPTMKITDQAYINIGTIYMERKDYQGAIKAYASAVESNNRNGFAHYYLGLSYLRAGEYEKAEIESQKAKKLGVPFTALSDKLNEIRSKSAKPADAGEKK